MAGQLPGLQLHLRRLARGELCTSVAAGEVAQPMLPFITQGGEFPEEVAAIDSLVATGERDTVVELMMAQIVGCMS